MHFYDDQYRGMPVRMAVLLQPVATDRARVMAVVQVAETLELRRTLARIWRAFTGSPIAIRPPCRLAPRTATTG